MRAIDLFGVFGRPGLGQVKNCPIFQDSTATPPVQTNPEPPPPAPLVAKGISLSADIQNDAGETARGIKLGPDFEPVFLVATALGIRADAPASASDLNQVGTISIPMMMTAQQPALIRSTLAAPRTGFSKKVWFFKIDRSPLTFSIPAEEMSDVDGAALSAVAFLFQPVGAFSVSPAAVVLKDGDRQSMRFAVKVASSLGFSKAYHVRNVIR